MRSNYKAIILAGGLGSRLRPITDETPKCLVEIAGRPILDYWMQALVNAGINDVLVNTHHHRDKVLEYFEQVEQSQGVRVTESYEPSLLGSAGTISANPDWIAEGQSCVIIYADNLSNIDLSKICEFHDSHDQGFTMMLFKTSKPKQCGIADLDESGRIVSFEEKPDEPKSNLANAGLYIVDAKEYQEIVNLKGFDIGFDILPKFVGRMKGWLFEGYHKDIGNLDALEQARAEANEIFN